MSKDTDEQTENLRITTCLFTFESLLHIAGFREKKLGRLFFARGFAMNLSQYHTVDQEDDPLPF